jgi:hypothetical protein
MTQSKSKPKPKPTRTPREPRVEKPYYFYTAIKDVYPLARELERVCDKLEAAGDVERKNEALFEARDRLRGWVEWTCRC